MGRADDPFGHFLEAQAPVFETVRDELTKGRKRSHWMWFIFPQLKALGRSSTARRFGLENLAEAEAFLAHGVLGPRLEDCVGLMLRHRGEDAEDILGTVDALKFRSCLTLFAQAGAGDSVFREALQAFYAGQPDPLTLELLGTSEIGG